MSFNFDDEQYSNISTERKNQILADVKADIERRTVNVNESLKNLNEKQLETYNTYLKLYKEMSK